jgi:glyoxylase-like metal-dependent hydrolase (beta-lactamase superfamily II)
MRILTSFLLLIASSGCAVTSQQSELVEAGRPARIDTLKANIKKSGPIHLQKIVAADWTADRSGLINLNDPKAKAAGLTGGDEDIQIYFYVLDHPRFGRFFIDSGVSEVILKDPDHTPISSIVDSVMHIARLRLHQSTKSFIEKDPRPVKGVLLTHMHLDHIMGIPDIRSEVPIYIGPRESTHKNFLNMFVKGSTDELLQGERKLAELRFTGEHSPNHPRVIDFFGDSTLFVISVPGHTPGSLAFLVSSDDGPQLITGDTCHTRWGWENTVSPGSFTEDQQQNQQSLEWLKDLAASIPGIRVHPGHQSTEDGGKLENIGTR